MTKRMQPKRVSIWIDFTSVGEAVAHLSKYPADAVIEIDRDSYEIYIVWSELESDEDYAARVAHEKQQNCFGRRSPRHSEIPTNIAKAGLG